MKKYQQISSEHRYQIYGLKQAVIKRGQIAEQVGVDKSMISREFSHNQAQRGWMSKQTQLFRDKRKQACLNGKRFSTDQWAEVDRLIRTDLSPEQTADRFALKERLKIGHEAICQHIYAGNSDGGMRVPAFAWT